MEWNPEVRERESSFIYSPQPKTMPEEATPEVSRRHENKLLPLQTRVSLSIYLYIYLSMFLYLSIRSNGEREEWNNMGRWMGPPIYRSAKRTVLLGTTGHCM